MSWGATIGLTHKLQLGQVPGKPGMAKVGETKLRQDVLVLLSRGKHIPMMRPLSRMFRKFGYTLHQVHIDPKWTLEQLRNHCPQMPLVVGYYLTNPDKVKVQKAFRGEFGAGEPMLIGTSLRLPPPLRPLFILEGSEVNDPQVLEEEVRAMFMRIRISS